MQKDVPIGVRTLELCFGSCRTYICRNNVFKLSILFLTFLAYMSYHIARKPFSIVKTVLYQNCSLLPNNEFHNDSTWCDWPPFNHSDSEELFGTLDSSFLFSYAIAMFFSGIIAERVNLRYFLALGMIFSGIFSYLLGLAKVFNIHSLWYFMIIQALMGIAQTTGWPAVVAVVGKWFGKEKRGLIFGVWNSHTSLGNILGSIIAAQYVETNWAYSFIMPGLFIAVIGFVLFLFLVVNPEDVHCPPPVENSRIVNDSSYTSVSTSSDTESDNNVSESDQGSYGVPYRRRRGSTNETIPIIETHQAISFLAALKIPGVVEYSLCLFFAKLVSYTFLFWLPFYIKSSTHLSASISGTISTVFDVGGIFGAILAGVVSDLTEMPATTCIGMLFAAAPSMYVYENYGSDSYTTNVVLLLISGCLVNGPYALITTAVSAELGTHASLRGNSKALATVTAIIDGTGSIGAAVGPLLTSLVSSSGWANVFYMLITSNMIALLLLTRLAYHELSKLRFYYRL